MRGGCRQARVHQDSRRQRRAQSACDYDFEVLSAFVDGELSRKEERTLRRHLQSCAACQQQVRSLAALKEAMARTAREQSLPRSLQAAVRRQMRAAKPKRK